MAKARQVKNIKCEAPVIENARRIIMVRLEELLSWTPYIDDPVNVPEIHHMRIAAKRLRYTLELFQPILGKGTNGLIDEVKTIQSHIGTMHDADVMIERVVGMISADGEERMSRHDGHCYRDRSRDGAAASAAYALAAVARHTVRDEVALYTLVAQHADHSVESYHEFIRAWGEMMETDFVGRLRQHIGVDPPPPPPAPKVKTPKVKPEATAVSEPTADEVTAPSAVADAIDEAATEVVTDAEPDADADIGIQSDADDDLADEPTSDTSEDVA